jgi:hypothetical protein
MKEYQAMKFEGPFTFTGEMFLDDPDSDYEELLAPGTKGTLLFYPSGMPPRVSRWRRLLRWLRLGR